MPFVQVPFLANRRPVSADRFGILTAKLYHPKVNSFMADVDLAFSQKIFGITQTQFETEVHPNGVIDDFGRKTVALKAGRILVFGQVRCLEIRRGAVNLVIEADRIVEGNISCKFPLAFALNNLQ